MIQINCRCGRTARIGNQGNALLFLLESEDAYINFIKRNQKVELKEMKLDVSSDFAQKCLKYMRTLQQNDRLLFDKATRAFVSYVQSYQKHECRLILRLKDLDLGKVAMSFGLLKMPRMPELKGQDLSAFCEDDVDINTITYKNKQREASRLEKLKEYKETGIWPSKKNRRMKKTEPWSEAKKNKLERQEKKKNKRERRKQKKELNTDSGPTKKKRRRGPSEEDLADLAKDIALIKKLKKKKVIKFCIGYDNIVSFLISNGLLFYFRLVNKNLILPSELMRKNYCKYSNLIIFRINILEKR